MIEDPAGPAYITQQAAAYIQNFRAVPPADVPLFAALLTAGASEWLKLPLPQAYAAVSVAGYVLGAAAVALLVAVTKRSWKQAAAGALLFAAAPSRLTALCAAGDAQRLWFWAFVPLAACFLALFVRKRSWMRAAAAGLALLLAAAAAPWPPAPEDAGAALELAFIAALFLAAPEWLGAPLRPLALLAFAGVSFWALAVAPLYEAPGFALPESLPAWAAERAGRGRILGPLRHSEWRHPEAAQAAELIRSNEHPEESVLWLEALGKRYLISSDWLKYNRLLGCVREENLWCAFLAPEARPFDALIVSRNEWERLRPVLGLLDVESLRAYVEWTQRSRQARLRELSPSTLEVRAELGLYDALLVRRPALPCWQAVLDDGGGPRPLKTLRDPVGFLLLDPQRTGNVTVRLTCHEGWSERLFPERLKSEPLGADPFPRIEPDGVIDAQSYEFPPFEPGAVVSIFGSNFTSGPVRVLFNGKPNEPLYVSDHQINIRIPEDIQEGRLEVIVEAGDRRSHPAFVEIASAEPSPPDETVNREP